MPTHTTLDPIEATTKAVDALLTAIDGALGAGAAAAYRSAIARHGRNLFDTAGPDALPAVFHRIKALARLHAEDHERIVVEAWAALPGWRS